MKRGKKETKNVVDVQEEVIEPVTEEIKEEVTEPITEEPITEEQSEQIIEESVTDEIKEIIEPVIVYNGRVDNCFKLNLRRKPNKNSEVISVLDKGQIVVILDQVNDFYKVEIDGLIGFCMKSYIEII